MSPKHEQPQDQGAMFDVEFVGNGATDPDSYSVTAELTPVADGVFPEDKIPEPEQVSEADKKLLETIHQEGITRRRSGAQLGKHTARGEDGKFGNLKPGMFLPGFGPVTYNNIAAAEARAAQLREEDR